MGLNMAGAAVIIPDSSDGTDPENPYADGNNLHLDIIKNPKIFKIYISRWSCASNKLLKWNINHEICRYL